MNELKEIVRIIADIGLKKVDSFPNPDADSAMLAAYFNGLASEELDDDTSVAKKLYNASPSDERFRQLKSRFREKLLDMVIFVDFPTPRFTTLRQKMYECNREQTAMKLCVENGAQDAGYAIANRLLVKARKFHLTIIELECLYIILNHILVCTGNVKEFERVSKELRYTQQKLHAETESEILYGAVSVKYAVIQSDHTENAPFIADCIEKLKLLLTQFDTFKIRYNYFLLCSLFTQTQRDYNARIQVCDEAILYFRTHSDISGNLPAVFSLEKIECFFHKRDFLLVFNHAKECEGLFNRYSSSWLSIKSFQIQALLCMGKPLQALEAFNTVQKLLKRNGGGAKKYGDQWLIIEGYVYLFIHTESKKLLPPSYRLPSINAYMRKFMTQGLHSLSGDKEGANVGMMILHVFLLICLKSNPSDIVEKVMALDRYKRRYINQTTNSRTEIFISLLRHYTLSAVDMKKANAKMKELFVKLSPLHSGTKASTEDYEIVPYDIIWERLMKFLGSEI